MILRKSQQLDIVKYANEQGIDPKIFQFVFEERKAFFWGFFKYKARYKTTEIKIKETNYYFKIASRNDRHIIDDEFIPHIAFVIHFSPDKDLMYKKLEFRVDTINYSWEIVLNLAKTWVYCLKEELKAANDWNKLMAIPDFINLNFSNEDLSGTFSEKEKFLLIDGISKLKLKLIEDFNLNTDEISIISKKLDELIVKVDSYSKFDFRSAFFGILINLSSSILYDSFPVFWSTITGIFGGVFGKDNSSSLLM